MIKPSVIQSTYQSLTDAFEKSSLSPQEQQIVLLTVCYEHGCGNYARRRFEQSLNNRLPEHIVDAIKENRPIQSEKLQALRQLTSEIINHEGWITKDMITSFITAGYNNQSIRDVLAGIGMQILECQQDRKSKLNSGRLISDSPNLKIV